MKKLIPLIFIFALLVISTPPTFGDEPVRVMKLATLAVEDISWGKGMKQFIFPEVERISGGKMQVKMFWGGVLGDEEEYLKKMKQGILAGGGFTAQGIMMACPETGVLSLPFLFNGWDEVDHVRETMHEVFSKLVEDRGYYFLFWTDQDFDQVYSSKFPMTSLEDFRKSRFIAWSGPVEAAFFREIGSPMVQIDVPGVGKAVREGRSDAAMGPAAWIVGAQLQGKIRYVNTIKTRYMLSSALITKDVWNSVNPQWRKTILERQIAIERRFNRYVRDDNEKFLKAIIQYGVRRSEMPPKELAAMKAAARPVWNRLAGTLYPKSLLDQVLDNLAAYRRRK